MSSQPARRARRRRGGSPDLSAAPLIAVALLALGLLMGDTLLYPWAVALGSRASEGPAHLWGLWATAAGILDYGPLVRSAPLSWPEGWARHLMDPINLVVFLPVYLLSGGGATGATLAWNALHAAAPVVAVLGCARLGRRVLGEDPAGPWAVALLAAIVAATPYLLATPWLGRTELLPATLWPLHLAWLHAWLRLPEGEGPGLDEAPRWRVGIAAGLSLGAMGLGGWYLVIFLGLLEPLVALWLSRRLPLRERVWRLGFVALLATLCVSPALWATLTFPPGALDQLGASPRSAQSFSKSTLDHALRLGTRRLEPATEQTPYVGVLAMAIGLVGVARAPRRASPWLAIGLLTLALSFGPYALLDGARAPGPRGAERAGLITMPAAWLMTWLSPLAMIRHWSRLTLLAALPIGVAAMEGLRALSPSSPRRRAALATLLLGGVLLDQSTWPLSWSLPRPSFSAAPPTELADALRALPEGALVVLPVGGRASDPHATFGVGMPQLWQLSHGRPISSGGAGEEDGPADWSALVALARQLQMSARSSGGAVSGASPTEEETACARVGAIGLRERGYAAVVLHLDADGASTLRPLLSAALGASAWESARLLAWDLSSLASAEGDPSERSCLASVRWAFPSSP